MVEPPSLTPTNETWREGHIWTWHGTEVIVAVFLLIVGILGNALVLHVYTFRLPSSTVTLIKRALAILDISAIVVTKPLIFYILLNPNSRFFDTVCVLGANFSLWNTSCANLILVVIAVDRYMRICQLHKRAGVHAELAKKLFVAIFVFCGLLDMPVFWLFGKTIKYVPEYGVTVTHCFFRTDKLKSTLFYVYYSMYLIFFLATSLTLLILYYKAIRRLQHHSRVQDRLYAIAPFPVSEMRARASSREAMRNSTVAFAIIAALYILTCSFFMLMLSFHAFGLGVEPAMTPRMQVIRDLAKQGPVYNRLFNPIIYSFTSSVFRKEARRLLLFKASDTPIDAFMSRSGSRTR